MPYSWHFYTGTGGINPVGRRCHRGPMIDVEITMSTPFVYLSQFNMLRKRLLNSVVDTELLPVQTREIVLRTLNTLLGPIFARLASRRKALQVAICEKRNSPAIEADLGEVTAFYTSAVRELISYKVPQQQIDLLVAALESNSPVVRVSGKCATILLMAFIEMDHQNG